MKDLTFDLKKRIISIDALRLANIPVYNNVLEYISISYLVCTILVLNTTKLVQYFVTGGSLLLVWAIFLFIPAPGWHGDISHRI